MNWYKQAQYDYYLYKYSWDWGKFLLPIMVSFIPILVYLGISPQDANKLAEKHNNDPVAIKGALDNIVQKNEVPPFLRSLPRTNKNEATKEQEPGVEVTQSPEYIDIAKYIAPHEGKKNKAYKDTKGKWTIGIGHLIVPGEEYLLSKILTDEEIDRLFANDLKKHINMAKKLFPKFDKYPPYIQASLTDSVYRGGTKNDIGPKTRVLINSDNWAAAADEYVNHEEYRASQKSRDGVHKRMDRNRDAMLQYAKELGQL